MCATVAAKEASSRFRRNRAGRKRRGRGRGDVWGEREESDKKLMDEGFLLKQID